MTFTTLWPNSRAPVHGLFVRERVLAMAASGAEITVIAPIPWIPPGFARAFPGYSRYDGVEPSELGGAVPVYHPRFVTFPKILKFLDGWLMGISVLWFLARSGIRWNFDFIDAHWLYPDGAAAVLIGKAYGTPVTVSVRGDDIRTFSKYRLRRTMLRHTLRNAAWVWAVCEDLRNWIGRIAPALPNVEVSPNGVDTAKFHPADRANCRERLGLPHPSTILVTVGRIEPAKGQRILLEALRILVSRGGKYHLAIVGPVDDEAYSNRMMEFADSCGLTGNVVWAGPQGHEFLPGWLCASDIFLMASENEGCPNALLEAMACQIPVVVTPVGGIPELVSEGDGCIFVDRTADAFAHGIEEMSRRLCGPGDGIGMIHRDIRSWGKVSRQVLERLESLGKDGSR